MNIDFLKSFFRKESDKDSSVSISVDDKSIEEPISMSSTSFRRESSDDSSESNNVFDSVSSDSYKKITEWAVYLGVFLVPLFFLPWTSSVLEINKQILLLIMASVSLVLWLLGVVSSGQLSYRKNTIDLGVSVFLGTVALATIFSVSKFKSLFGLPGNLSNSLVAIASLSAIYFVAVNVFDDKGKKLLSVLSISAFIVLLFGFLQILGIYLLGFLDFWANRNFNTVGSINALAMVGAIFLPVFYRLRTGNIRWLSYINLASFILSLVLLVIINWSVLWIIAISGMVGLVAFGNVNKDKFRIKKFLIPMIGIVLAVFLMTIDLDISSVKNKLSVEVGPSYGLSKDITVSVIKEKFLFGYGPENFSLAFDRYGAGRLANTNLAETKFFNSASEFTDSVINGGIILGLASIFLFVVLFWSIIRRIKNSNLSGRVEAVLASLVAVSVAFFLYPFNLTLFLVLYMLMALTVLMLWGEDKLDLNIESRTSLSLASSLGFIGGLILVLVSLYFGGSAYLADVKYTRALISPDNQKAAQLIIEAINLNGSDDRFYRLGSRVALNLLVSELNNTSVTSGDRATKIQNYISTAISLSRRATEIAPRESLNWFNLGSTYQNLMALVDGADKLAEAAYEEAAQRRPRDPSFYNRIGLMYLAKYDLLIQRVSNKAISQSVFTDQAQDALTKAEQSLKKTLEISNNFGLAIYNLGSVYDRQGRLGEAISQLEKLAPFNSNQPGLTFELGLLYYRNEQKSQAFDQLQKAVLLYPDYSNARWYLALIYEERGNLGEAINQLERIINLDINKDNEIVLGKLEELRQGKTQFPPGNILDQQPIQ